MYIAFFHYLMHPVYKFDIVQYIVYVILINTYRCLFNIGIVLCRKRENGRMVGR